MNDHFIRAIDGGTVAITEYDPGKLFLSISFESCRASTVLTANEARALVAALNQAIVEVEQEVAA